MPVVWNPKKWLAVERDIYHPIELQTLLAGKSGVQLSLQAVSALINGRPSALQLQTMQELCNALECEHFDFCNVLPETVQGQKEKSRKVAGGVPIRLYGAKTTSSASKESSSPDLHKYATGPRDGQVEG